MSGNRPYAVEERKKPSILPKLLGGAALAGGAGLLADTFLNEGRGLSAITNYGKGLFGGNTANKPPAIGKRVFDDLSRNAVSKLERPEYFNDMLMGNGDIHSKIRLGSVGLEGTGTISGWLGKMKPSLGKLKPLGAVGAAVENVNVANEMMDDWVDGMDNFGLPVGRYEKGIRVVAPTLLGLAGAASSKSPYAAAGSIGLQGIAAARRFFNQKWDRIAHPTIDNANFKDNVNTLFGYASKGDGEAVNQWFTQMTNTKPVEERYTNGLVELLDYVGEVGGRGNGETPFNTIMNLRKLTAPLRK